MVQPHASQALVLDDDNRLDPTAAGEFTLNAASKPILGYAVRRLPEKRATLSVQNIYTAGWPISLVGVQQAIRRRVADRQAHSQEEVVIKALFALAEAKMGQAPAEGAPILESVARVLPVVGAGVALAWRSSPQLTACTGSAL